MKTVVRIVIPALAGLALASMASASPSPATTLEAALTPGPEQARLNDLVGNFDVVISIWVTPKSVPITSNAAAVSSWVLDGRYVQTSLAGYVDGQPYKALGFVGYDNAGKLYQASWMDNESTAQTWYSGGFKPGSKAAVLSANAVNPISGKTEALELRMRIDAAGNHVTELWGTGGGSKAFKMMELRYTRSKS